jgi:hypothetical protein
MTRRSHEASTSELFSPSGLEEAVLWDRPHEEGSISYAEADLSRPEFTFRIQDIPQDERPRDRLFLHGAKALSSAELLSILFGTGHGASGLSSFGLERRVGSAHLPTRLLPPIRDPWLKFSSPSPNTRPSTRLHSRRGKVSHPGHLRRSARIIILTWDIMNTGYSRLFYDIRS